MARRYRDMMETAYVALQSHGVDYKSLKEFKNTELLDDADKAQFRRGVQLVSLWLERLESGITAAVRRKAMRPVLA